jgi:TolA-binding protein
MRFKTAIALALTATALSPAIAQRRPPTPEQRIDRLEKQVRQVQKQVFPKGQPADTAGVIDDPAATQASVDTMGSRLDAVERQLAEIVRQSEENGNRVATMEAELARLKADADRRAVQAEAAPPPVTEGGDPAPEADEPPPPTISRPKVERSRGAGAAPSEPVVPVAAGADPAEAAYDAGYQQWTRGQYDNAIRSLNAMAAKYPGHRRVSWAYNLAGRAQLDKGDYRNAADTLLKNYRRDPNGERAQDSVFYLGQALMKLNQPTQACKAYAELETVYAGRIRAPLAASLAPAKAEAKCR